MQSNQQNSIVIVGGGGSLRDSNLGKKIDEFDLVYRINNWKTHGYEKDAGKKTDIWITYRPDKKIEKFIRDYKSRDLDIDTIRDLTKGVKEVWYLSWLIDNLLYNWRNNKSLLDLDIYDRIKRHQLPTHSKRVRRISNFPSTGFISIYTLNQMYDKMYIAGFDFWGRQKEEKHEHYFTDIKIKDLPYRKSGFIHTPEKEVEYVEKLIDKGELEYLTEDTKITKANPRYKTHDLVCPSCKKINTHYQWENKICNYCEYIWEH